MSYINISSSKVSSFKKLKQQKSHSNQSSIDQSIINPSIHPLIHPLIHRSIHWSIDPSIDPLIHRSIGLILHYFERQNKRLMAKHLRNKFESFSKCTLDHCYLWEKQSKSISHETQKFLLFQSGEKNGIGS